MISLVLSVEYSFIKDYYLFLIFYFALLIFYSLLNDINFNFVRYRLFHVLTIVFTFLVALKIGFRELDIGTDTRNYHYMYYYNYLSGDFLYDFLSYLFHKLHLKFEVFMTFCALIYMFATLYACKVVFKYNYFYVYIIFLMYPYFMLFGINGVRNGMAASIFLLGLSQLYKNKKRQSFFLFICSLLIHLSMLVPALLFLFRKYISNTSLLLLVWLFSILLLLNVNILYTIVPLIPVIGPRFGSYFAIFLNEYDLNSFLIFGIPPVLFGFYSIYVKKFKEYFYINLLNIYVVIHIFYILSLKTVFAIRIGYLAEFMMLFLIGFPLFSPIVINKNRFLNFKWSVFIFSLFIVKAYKILII